MPRQLEQSVHAVAGLHLAGTLDLDVIDEGRTMWPSLRERRSESYGGMVQQ